MAFEEKLAARVRVMAVEQNKMTEKRMFGGLAFLDRGKMVCGVLGNELVVRVGPDAHAEALLEPHARPMDFTGRPMKGFIYVGAEGLRSDKNLKRWIKAGLAGAESAKPRGHKKRR